MAKHKKGPVDRFHGWSPEHQAKVLQRLGITSDEFAGKGRGQQRRLIRRSQAKAGAQHVAAQQKQQQANDPAYFTQPLTQNTAGALADQMTNLKYGTAESQLQTRQAQVPPWFQNYQAQIGATRQAVQQQNAPIIGNVQAQAQNTGQTVLKDVDPNSEAAHNDTLAAAARQALVASFASKLNADQAAANTYFGQQQSVVAPQYQQSVSTGLANQASDLAQEKGAYRASTLGDLRDKAHTQNLENAAFGLDEQKAANDVAVDSAKLKADARKSRATARAKGQTVNAHGYTAKAWNAMSVEQRRSIIAADKKTGKSGGAKDKNGLTPAQRRSAREKTGKAVQRITDIKGEYNRYAGQTNKDPKTGKAIKPTRNQVIQQLRSDGYSPAEIQLGLKVRSNEPLTKADVRTAKRLGIWPLPKAWTLKGKKTGAAAYPTNPGSVYGPK